MAVESACSPWYFTFIPGVVSGFIANWLWHKWCQRDKKPRFTMTSADGVTSFSGVMTQENQTNIIRALRAPATSAPVATRSNTDDSSTST